MRFPPLCIFPEGGTSNSRYLLSFKKGAFIGEKTVRPVVLKYNYTNFSPCYDIMPFIPLVILTMSYGWFTCTVKVLPPFKPNEYLFETHADKGKDRWEIYAWAVREVMAKAGPLIKNDQPYREKLKYEAILGYKNPLKETKKTPLLDNTQ